MKLDEYTCSKSAMFNEYESITKRLDKLKNGPSNFGECVMGSIFRYSAPGAISLYGVALTSLVGSSAIVPFAVLGAVTISLASSEILRYAFRKKGISDEILELQSRKQVISDELAKMTARENVATKSLSQSDILKEEINDILCEFDDKKLLYEIRDMLVDFKDVSSQDVVSQDKPKIRKKTL